MGFCSLQSCHRHLVFDVGIQRLAVDPSSVKAARPLVSVRFVMLVLVSFYQLARSRQRWPAAAVWDSDVPTAFSAWPGALPGGPRRSVDGRERMRTFAAAQVAAVKRRPQASGAFMLASVPMRISARNQLRGTVTSVKLGNVMAEVVVQVGEADRVRHHARRRRATRALSGQTSNRRHQGHRGDAGNRRVVHETLHAPRHPKSVTESRHSSSCSLSRSECRPKSLTS